ncbi:MAG: GAF domain-containing protein [Holophagales bacterium]|nr:GAF domain-containing protein [Holophagales bacterium]
MNAAERELDLSRQLTGMVERMCALLQAERATLFLYDEEKHELWSRVLLSDGASHEIRLSANEGIAGHVMVTGDSLRIDDAATDPRFAKRFDQESGFVTRSMLCEPLIDSRGRRIGVVQVLNKLGGGTFTEWDGELLDAMRAEAAIALENAQILHELDAAREAELALNEKLKGQHKELQDAFRRLEEANAETQAALGREKLLRWGAAAAATLLVAVVGWVSFRGAAPARSATPRGPASAERTIELAPSPVEAKVALAGRLEPLRMEALTAPFDATVRRFPARYGEAVAEGELLLVLDTQRIDVELRDAEADEIRAAQRVRELETWQGSSQVAEAERSLAKARLSYERARRDAAEAKRLFDKGIVGRGEYESAEAGETTAELDLRSAEASLSGVRGRGDDESVRLAQMALANARVKLREVQERRRRAEVRAPFAGVLLLPGSAGGAGGERLSEGATVGAGKPLLTIADLSSFAVVSTADEMDVAKLATGQSARVASEAFPGARVEGRVHSVAAQPSGEDGGGGFGVVIEITSAPPEVAGRFRLGMPAAADVVTYAAPAALMVPVAALRREANGYEVEVEGPGGRERRPVEVGVTTLDAVEIRSGLAAGERVVVPGVR